MTAGVSSSSNSSIERAVALHGKLFLAYLIVLIVAALATVVFTALVWRSGNKVQDAIRADAEAKIATANAGADAARKEAAVANENTARLSLRVEEESKERIKAELELERLKKQVGPRLLNREAFLKALEGQPKAPVQVLYLRDDPDSLEFAQEIAGLLERAGWTVTAREPIPTPSAVRSGPDIPIAMSVGGQPSGVTVVAHSISEKESEAGLNRSMGKEWVKTPWTVLSDAFGKSMGVAQSAGNVATCPVGILRVVVGPRR